MPTLTVMDPVTRIEGHLKVEVSIDTVGNENQIVDARCTGTLFRGFETILEGREPTDAPRMGAIIHPCSTLSCIGPRSLRTRGISCGSA